jgi:hypothetical protein
MLTQLVCLLHLLHIEEILVVVLPFSLKDGLGCWVYALCYGYNESNSKEESNKKNRTPIFPGERSSN